MRTEYASVALLTEPEQLRLLELGDAPERLWAAWALALRYGRKALPTLVALSDEALTEGLKRQLLVVLAGLGARPILFAIATTDPTLAVRATAVAYYIRTAWDAESELTTAFAIDQLHTRIPELALAVLAEHEMSRVDIPEEELIACLEDPHLEVRQAAVQCILSKDAISEGARNGMLRLLAGEPAAPLRQQVLDYLPRPSVPLLVRFLSGAPAKRIVEILDRVRQKFGLLHWHELNGLAMTPEPSVIDALMHNLDVPLPSDAIPWLGLIYATSISGADPVWRDIQWRSNYALRRSLCADNAHLLVPEVNARLRQDVERELAYFDSATPDELEDSDYSEEYGVELKGLLAVLLEAV